MPYVPIVDISADPGVVGAELDEICRTVGFFQITGHGIADDITEPAWRLATAFFDLPLDDKNANWSTRVSCLPTCLGPGETPRYEPVLAGPHLMSKFRRSVTFRESA